MMPTIIEIAFHYVFEIGWSVFPCRIATKKPAVRSWKPYQQTRPQLKDLDRLFCKDRNIAIVCGDVSGGLVVRDFDSKARYEDWSTNHPDLAKTLPTARTATGYHCYCRMTPCPKVRVNGVDDGELRGNGAYVIAPPSVHPSGAVYEWIVPPAAELQTVELADLDLGHLEGKLAVGDMLQSQCSQPSQCSQRSQRSQLSQQRSTDVVSEEAPNFSEIEKAIRESVPTGPGLRNKALFDLARRLKGIQSSPFTLEELTPVFDRWHVLSEPMLTTKDYATSFGDFLRAIDCAQTAYGATMRDHLRQAMIDGSTNWLSSEKFDQRCRTLGSLCRQLQRANGSEPFYLSAHTAAELLDTKPMQCWRWLDLFVRLGKLSKVETGNLANRKATRFRYIADDL